MARGIRTRDRQRDPALIPADVASSPAIRGFLERLRAELESPRGEVLVRALRRLGELPAEEQQKLAGVARATRVTADVMSLETSPRWRLERGWRLVPVPRRETVARWLLAHALRRGLALPKLQHADLFAAIAELIGNHEDIAAAMDRARDQRGPMTKTPSRRLDQRKVMTRLSRLNARRRKAGYPNL